MYKTRELTLAFMYTKYIENLSEIYWKPLHPWIRNRKDKEGDGGKKGQKMGLPCKKFKNNPKEAKLVWENHGLKLICLMRFKILYI